MMQRRRDFLKTALGASAASALLASRGTLAGSEPAGMRPRIQSTGSKIKSIETFTNGPLSIVRVRTDSSQEGYGQIAPFNADIVQPDICYIGGLTRALRVADMAASTKLPCVPHSANLSMVTVFTLHMLGAIRSAGPYVEFSIEPTSWTDNLFEPALKVTDGKVTIPDGPGWGVTINKDWLAKAERQVTEKA